MRELQKQSYDKVAVLFADYTHHGPIFGSVLEGRKPGRVFVDDEERPVVAFLLVSGTWSYFAGRAPSTEFVQEAVEFAFGLVPDELGEVVIFAPDDAFRLLLDEVLAERRAIRIHRKTFRFSPEGFSAGGSACASIPVGMAIEGFELGESGEFGVRLVASGNVMSECKSVFVGYGQAEISVHTEESQRGHGYAALTSAAFVRECLKRGLIPCWGCWPYNEASERLATKLGFAATEDMPAHFWAPGM